MRVHRRRCRPKGPTLPRECKGPLPPGAPKGGRTARKGARAPVPVVVRGRATAPRTRRDRSTSLEGEVTRYLVVARVEVSLRLRQSSEPTMTPSHLDVTRHLSE